ncbi:MAG: flagellar filament capping protein FliD [Curvibacter lanceolatus]|jgi:flagellar hook-associated protein 2|uniref:flagellar filament capping protein FliD n=1 Tax=Curvibacter lanceolatus TaxID=86182 RepID=UPI002357C90A|nr:flagellar filament capping protein FliD [Curvibacter lanceolatus]MBV5293583.1 flagellar filament capping protein FliD [Curvibacter lanceolatus]
MTTSSVTPSTTATQLATAYTQAAQSLLTRQTQSAQATATALTQLQTALSTFNSALSALNSNASGSSLQQQSATLSSSGYASASATPTAQVGSYPLFVEQVATTHQLAFQDLPAVPVSLGGPLVVKLADGSNFTVDLVAADQNSDGTISQAEIARAINQAPNNGSKVTATTITVGSQTQLVLTAGQSGAANQISLDTSGLPPSNLQTALSNSTQITAANDAIVWLGAQGSGIKIQQSSNTVTALAGVTLTLTKAQQSGDAPLNLSVAADNSGTAANVKKFVDAYNALEKSLDTLTANGNENTTRAALASDPGVMALRSRLSNTLRQSFGGLSLMNFGLSVDRSGTVSLDSTKLQAALTTNPGGLDQVFGNASLSAPAGVLGTFQSVLKVWTDSSNGQIKQRQDTVQAQQKALTTRQSRLDDQYNQAYARYLAQFTQLQTLQSSMNDTTSLLANLGA